ncbi:P68 family surface lipoprotein [Metamycoplasma hominis]|uniref:P68 family surface lipoprotein n=1 Tax=Metamycoplasma hominis TaxID=2098 RepID=UPI00036A662E|nr:P80 family lipoprotein [Metamycoplasma hominis]AIU33824.1 putative polynucleotide-binding lipoprotein [Metamycoplasma hominis ATCC 27545]
MKKINKILLGLAPAAALIAASGLSAACGHTGTGYGFDQTDDGKLVLASGFSNTNKQGIALKAVVDAYNKWIKDNNKQSEGYLPVEVKTLANGYNTNTLRSDLDAKNSNDFYNMTLNYPAAASILSQYKMNLAISKEDYDKFGIENGFNLGNDLIGGNTKKEKWVVPLSRSSEMLSVAKALVGKFIKELKDLGVKISDKDNTKVNEYLKYYTDNTNEAQGVNETWAHAKSDKIDKEQIVKALPEMSDQIFRDYSSMINFSIQAKKMYNKDPLLNVIGFDSLPNVINTMTTSLTGGDINKGYIKPDEDKITTGGFDYSTFLKDANSEQSKLFKKIVDLILEGVKEGAVWIGGAGAYGSNNLLKYQLAMSLGSTAGYSHTFSTAKSLTNLKIKDTTTSLDQSTLEVSSQIPKESDKWVIQIKSGKHTNGVYGKNNWASAKKYDKKITQEAADIIKKQVQGQEGYLVELSSTFEYKNNKISLKKVNKELDAVYLGKIYEGNEKEYFFLKKSQVVNEVVSSNKILNQDDADWISSPLAFDKTTKKAVFIQGPSILPIHANEKEDKATKLFINWMFQHDLENFEIVEVFKGEPKTTKFDGKQKPIDIFNEYGSYISPTKSYFSSDKASKLNTATKIAFDNFKQLDNKDSGYIPSEDIATSLSDVLREAITSAGKAALSKANVNEVFEYKEFVSKILGQLSNQL